MASRLNVAGLAGAIALMGLCLVGCAMPPDSVNIVERPITLSPEEPVIGQRVLVRVKNQSPEFTVVDGDYEVSIERLKVDEQPWWAWLVPQSPAPVTPKDPFGENRVVLGTVTVAQGVGELTFELKPDFGRGVTAEPGKPMSLGLRGAYMTTGKGFMVAR